MFQVATNRSIRANDFGRAWQQILSRIPKKCSIIPTVCSDKYQVGISLSGGPDSTLLAHLAIQHFGPERVHLFTINHNIPDWLVEPTDRIKQFATNQWGTSVKHSILNLNWDSLTEDGKKKKGGGREMTKSHLQNDCRNKRYQILFDTLKRERIPFLLCGHNFDDDFVTHCHRLARYSGIDGIAGIKPLSTFPIDGAGSDEVLIARPFLDFSKQHLLESCKEANLEWVDDPTNEDLDFARNASMRAISEIQTVNPRITFDRIYSFMQHLKEHRSYIQQRVVEASHSLIEHPTDGSIMLVLNDKKWPFCNPVAWRLLNYAVQAVSCSAYPPSTPTSLEIIGKIQRAFVAFQTARKHDMSRIPRALLAQFNVGDSNLYWQTKRLGMKQSTLSGCSVYPLASNDAVTRLREHKHLTKSNIEPGPCILILGATKTKLESDKVYHLAIQPPSTSKSQSQIPSNNNNNNHVEPNYTILEQDFIDPNIYSYIWNNRYKITIKMKGPIEMVRKFTITSLSLDFLKQHASSLRKSVALGKLYTMMGSTPSQFFNNFPLLTDQLDKSKFVIPNIAYHTDKCDFEVEGKFLGSHILMSKLYLE